MAMTPSDGAKLTEFEQSMLILAGDVGFHVHRAVRKEVLAHAPIDAKQAAEIAIEQCRRLEAMLVKWKGD